MPTVPLYGPHGIEVRIPFPALSATELAQCNEGLARFEHWLGTPVNQGDFRWRSASYVFLPWVDALVRHPRILDAVEDLIGPDILVYTATWFIKEAHSPAFAAWHQDATYFGLMPNDQHVTAWVALSDASAKAGCMEVASSKGRPEPTAVSATTAWAASRSSTACRCPPCRRRCRRRPA